MTGNRNVADLENFTESFMGGLIEKSKHKERFRELKKPNKVQIITSPLNSLKHIKNKH